MARPCLVYDFVKEYADRINPNLDLRELATSLAVLPYDHLVIIQVLLIHYNYLHGGYESIPFGGQLLTNTNGARYNLSKFPNRLIKILAAYLELAIKLQIN